MTYRNSTTVSIVLVVSLLLVNLFRPQIKAAQTNDIAVEISFDKSLPTNDVSKLGKYKELRVKYLVYRWGEHTGWYVLTDGETLDHALSAFTRQHEEFLRRQLVESSLRMSSANEDRVKDLLHSRTRVTQDFADQLYDFYNRGLLISGLAVEGQADNVGALVDEFPHADSTVVSINKGEGGINTKPKGTLAATATMTGTPYPNEPWKFSPSSGTIAYDAASNYFSSDFQWSDVSGFSSVHSAYEHDITLGVAKDTYVRPATGKTYYTNLPYPYIDTTAMDKLASFTIGTMSSTSIQINHPYYTQIPVELIDPAGGPTSGSVQPQLGSWAGEYDEGEKPSEGSEKAFCKANGSVPAYCVFADQTYTIKDYYTAGRPTSLSSFPFDYRFSISYSWDKKVKPPTINPGSVTSQSSVTATISTATSGAEIRYTTDGSDPSGGSALYSGPLTFASSVTLKARAFKAGLTDSDVATATYTIQQPAPVPTIKGFTWDRTPTQGQSFNGTITGTNFVVNGTSVSFCIAGTNTCYQQPPTLVSVTGSTTLNVSGVNLSAGSWQIVAKTSAGSSAPSTAFTVQPPTVLPTISGYTWDRTPTGGQPFNGTITGTDLVQNATSVFFCVTGTSTCYPQPAAGVNVTSSTNINVSNVNLSAGSWQIYVQTPAGSSAKSSAFTVQSPPSPPTITGYSWDRTPIAGQNFNGTISGTNFVANATSVFFCVTGSSTCYQHPAAGVSVVSITSLDVSNVNLGAGSWQIYVQTAAGASVRSSSFTVQSPPPPPTISSYSWDRTPTAGQPFNGKINGSNFVVGGTSVFFCVTGSSTCYQHPAAGVSVVSSTSLNVSNVNLGVGSWQIYVQTAAGSSARSSSFTVQAPPSPPTISSYSWDRTPTAGQTFNGTINGSNFVAGGTSVFFCVTGSSTCYQHPAAGVSVNSTTSLSVSNVNLSAGSWQIYLLTSAGQSARSSSFTVRIGPPTITSYSWTTTPSGGQPFGGTINGTNFVVGGTSVFFCISGSSTCYQHPAAGVNVTNSTSLSVSNVNLSSGSWQFYLQTSNGQSSRSSTFTVR